MVFVSADWRTAYIVLGAAVLVGMLPLCLFVVRDSPEEMGMRPDGDAAVLGAPTPFITRTPASTALRTVAFWQLGGSFFTCGFSMALVAVHGVPMLTDHGYSPSVGSILGVIFLVHQTGAALGSWLAGALFEATGGYGAMFAIACVLLTAAGLVSVRVDREPGMLRWAARGAGA
jgi:hypothetical protein